MPFSERVQRLERERTSVCDFCGIPFGEGDARRHVHSATTFHLERNPDGFLVATSVNMGQEHFLGKAFSPNAFPELGARDSDAFSPCWRCHGLIHRRAKFAQERMRGFGGVYVAAPQILLTETLKAINPKLGLVAQVATAKPESQKTPSNPSIDLSVPCHPLTEVRAKVDTAPETPLFQGLDVGGRTRKKNGGDDTGVRAYVSNQYNLFDIRLVPKGKGR